MIERAAWAALAGSTLAIGMVLAAGGCSSSTSTMADPGIVPDAAPSDGAARQGDGRAPADASTGNDGAAEGGAGACTGACTTTALVADFGGKKRTLVRAQFGTEPGDGGAQLHTESHLGGSPACPTAQSPTPDYTLIVGAVPRGATGRKLTERDGLTGAFFDFKGDLGLDPLIKAITMDVTVVAEDPATPPAWVALDVNAGFSQGTVTGHMYAAYCASLSQ